MKYYILTGVLTFLAGLVVGTAIQRNLAPEKPPLAAAPEGSPSEQKTYKVVGPSKEKDFLPEEAYKTFIVGENGQPRSFEQFKESLAKMKMVNPNAPNFRQEALLVYAAALVRVFGEKAIDEITQSPILANFGPTAPGMFEMMFDLYGKDVAVKLIESYTSNQIKSMLYGMLATRLIETNYDEALNVARMHAPMQLKDPTFVNQMVRVAGQNLDEDSLLALVTSFDSAQTRLIAAEAVGEMLWSPDPNDIESTLAKLSAMEDSVLRKAFSDSFLSRAVTLHPEILLNPAFAGTQIHQQHFHTAGQFMSARGWEEAVNMGLKITSDEDRQVYMMGVVEATVSSGDNATAIDQSIKAYNEGIDDGQMLSRAVSAVARYSPKEAAEFLSRPNLPTEVRETLLINTIQDIATVDIAQAKTLLRSSQHTEATRDRLYADMATHLARENPESAFTETLSQIRDPMYRSIAAKDVAQEYFRNDSESCLNWLLRFPAGSVRDDLTSAIANEMMKTDVLGAIDVATQVGDPNSRIATLSAIYGNARYLQPALAEAWAKENPEWVRLINESENSVPTP